jgi:hypothetical protein
MPSTCLCLCRNAEEGRCRRQVWAVAPGADVAQGWLAAVGAAGVDLVGLRVARRAAPARHLLLRQGRMDVVLVVVMVVVVMEMVVEVEVRAGPTSGGEAWVSACRCVCVCIKR